MIYSVSYKSKHLSAAGEIVCPYNQLGQIYDFMKEHPEKRYIVTVSKDADINKLHEQLEYLKMVIGDNYTLSVSLEMARVLKNKSNIRYFINYPVADWETFNVYKALGVTDIWIDGPLCFDMPTIAKKKQNIKIRISPVFSPNSIRIMGDLVDFSFETTFFIRPEDISKECYSPIDIIDFKTGDQEKEDALFDIYNRGEFLFDIDKLILGLRPGVSNMKLDAEPDWASRRSQCKQKCQHTSNCHYCRTIFDLVELSSKLKGEREEG